MQQRSTGQIWAKGHCSRETASAHGVHTLLSKLPWRLVFFLQFDVNYPDSNLQGYDVIMLTDRQIAGKMLKTASVVFPTPKGVSRIPICKDDTQILTHKVKALPSDTDAACKYPFTTAKPVFTPL